MLKLDWHYALGELVIVTAGVLVALAIDQWNSDRLDRAEEIQIIERLLVDLNADLDGIALGLRILDNKETALAQVHEARQRLDANLINSTEVLQNVIRGANYGWNQYRASRTTFDEMLSSGRFGLIRSAELRAQISAYYTREEGEAARIGERETAYPSLSYELAPRLHEADLDPTIAPGERDRLAERVIALDLDGPIRAEINFARFVRDRFTVLDSACRELISALEEYLAEIR